MNKIFELTSKYPDTRRIFQKLLTKYGWYNVWQIMNDVKPLHLIPGTNVVTVYQVAEYFDVALRHIKNIEKKYYLEDDLNRVLAHDDEFSFLALRKKPVMFEGVKHTQYDFKDFSIHAAPAGAICYTPKAVIRFLPYIQGSEVCSEVICRLVKGYTGPDSFDGVMNISILRECVEQYEAQVKADKEKAQKEAEAKALVMKAIEDLNVDVSVLATINI